MKPEIKFSHTWLNYDPYSRVNSHNKPITEMILKEISEMQEYSEGDFKNRVMMSVFNERLCKDIDNPYQYWNGCIWVDIDYKDFPNATIEKWYDISLYINSDIESTYTDNYYYYETSRSHKGGHFIFYYECEHNEYNFKKYSAISRKIVYDSFVRNGFKDIIDYEGVFDSCCKSIFQCVYITKIDCIYFNNCNGKTNNEYPEIEIKNDTKSNKTIKSNNYMFKCQEWIKPNKVDYIEHSTRWKLFCSLSKIFEGDELKKEWIKISSLIPEKNGHTIRYYNNVPYTLDWNDKLTGEEYCDTELLKKFGYIINIKKIDKNINLINKLYEELFN